MVWQCENQAAAHRVVLCRSWHASASNGDLAYFRPRVPMEQRRPAGSLKQQWTMRVVGKGTDGSALSRSKISFITPKVFAKIGRMFRPC